MKNVNELKERIKKYENFSTEEFACIGYGSSTKPLQDYFDLDNELYATKSFPKSANGSHHSWLYFISRKLSDTITKPKDLLEIYNEAVDFVAKWSPSLECHYGNGIISSSKKPHVRIYTRDEPSLPYDAKKWFDQNQKEKIVVCIVFSMTIIVFSNTLKWRPQVQKTSSGHDVRIYHDKVIFKNAVITKADLAELQQLLKDATTN